MVKMEQARFDLCILAVIICFLVIVSPLKTIQSRVARGGSHDFVFESANVSWCKSTLTRNNVKENGLIASLNPKNVFFTLIFQRFVKEHFLTLS